jgi:shikimate dehydrogenase
LLGLVGRGILESKSRSLHENEAAAQGFRCVYELIDFDQSGTGNEQLGALLSQVEGRGFAGVNITYPFKQAVIPLLDELSQEAQAIGAVNTIHFQNGRRIGYNTDARGFAESFRRGLSGAQLSSVLQIGAGGAGAATAFVLLELGVRQLTLIDTDFVRASSLANGLASRFADRDVRAIHERELAHTLTAAKGVVNSTPMGMANHPGSALPAGLLRSDLWVAEIVYVPLETSLLRAARAAGCRTLDGSGMVVYQAAKAFEIFTSRAADAERMRRHFEKITRS